jgi:hypothetical protein
VRRLACSIVSVVSPRVALPFRQIALLHSVTCVQLRLQTVLGNRSCVAVASFLGFRLREPDFKASTIGNTNICGESPSAHDLSVDSFREKHKNILELADLSLFWKAVPENTQANKKTAQLNKELSTSLVCTNADAPHHVIPVIIGKSAKPRPLRHIIKDMSIIYMSIRKHGKHENCLLTAFITFSYLRLRNIRCIILKMNLQT